MKNPITAQRLISAMAAANITAKELSDKTGVSQASISQYMNGTHSPSNQAALKLATVLNVNAVWLMGFDVDRNNHLAIYSKLIAAYANAPKGIQEAVNKLLDLKEGE